MVSVRLMVNVLDEIIVSEASVEDQLIQRKYEAEVSLTILTTLKGESIHDSEN